MYTDKELSLLCRWAYSPSDPVPVSHEGRVDIQHENAWASVLYDKDGDATVVIRGTDEPLDWVDNVSFFRRAEGLGRIHRGFADHASKIANEVMAAASKVEPGSKVILTGHSLGGAAAVLIAYWMLIRGTEQEVYVVGFGAPRVGDRYFQQAYRNHGLADRTRLYAFADDIVPTVPYGMDYRHVNDVWVHRNSGWHPEEYRVGPAAEIVTDAFQRTARDIKLREVIKRKADSHSASRYAESI